MPAYQVKDGRHPVNRARLLHAAALGAWGDNVVHPVIWRKAQVMVFGPLNRQNLHSYTQRMEDMGMVQITDNGVRVLPAESVLLPLCLEAAEA